MLTLALTLALCPPAFADGTIAGNLGRSCQNRFADNLLTAWADTTLVGSWPGNTIGATIVPYSVAIGTCTTGVRADGGCFDTQMLDGNKKAKATGVTAGLMEGPLQFRSKHYENGGTPFGVLELCITCPPPPEPTACGKVCSPIIVPIEDGNQVKLSSAEQGVSFDIDGDGDLEYVAWPEEVSKVAFLAMDRNGDGSITSGKELFGNAVDGARSAFQALSFVERVVPNSWLVAGRDRGFDSLLLWFDRNRDGISQSSELEKATDYLNEISLFAVGSGKRDEHGNLFKMKGLMKLRSKPDETRPIYDVFLVTRQ